MPQAGVLRMRRHGLKGKAALRPEDTGPAGYSVSSSSFCWVGKWCLGLRIAGPAGYGVLSPLFHFIAPFFSFPLPLPPLLSCWMSPWPFFPPSSSPASEKINFSYYILLHLITSYSSYFGGMKGISGNKTSFFLLM